MERSQRQERSEEIGGRSLYLSKAVLESEVSQPVVMTPRCSYEADDTLYAQIPYSSQEPLWYIFEEQRHEAVLVHGSRTEKDGATPVAEQHKGAIPFQSK